MWKNSPIGLSRYSMLRTHYSSCLPCLEFVQPEHLEKPLLHPFIETVVSLPNIQSFLISFYSAANDLSSVLSLEDRRWRDMEKDSPIYSPDKRVRSQEPNRAAQ